MSVLADGPLQFTFQLTPDVTITTNVFGTARNNAGVQIVGGTIPLWSGSMSQGATKVVVDMEIEYGSTIIQQGAWFNLTIPSEFQMGQVIFSGTVSSGGNPAKKTTVQVAQWPLNSAVTE